MGSTSQHCSLHPASFTHQPPLQAFFNTLLPSPFITQFTWQHQPPTPFPTSHHSSAFRVSITTLHWAIQGGQQPINFFSHPHHTSLCVLRCVLLPHISPPPHTSCILCPSGPHHIFTFSLHLPHCHIPTTLHTFHSHSIFHTFISFFAFASPHSSHHSSSSHTAPGTSVPTILPHSLIIQAPNSLGSSKAPIFPIRHIIFQQAPPKQGKSPSRSILHKAFLGAFQVHSKQRGWAFKFQFIHPLGAFQVPPIILPIHSIQSSFQIFPIPISRVPQSFRVQSFPIPWGGQIHFSNSNKLFSQNFPFL